MLGCWIAGLYGSHCPLPSCGGCLVNSHPDGKKKKMQASPRAFACSCDMGRCARRLIQQAQRQHWTVQAWRRASTFFLHHVSALARPCPRFVLAFLGPG